MHKSFLTITVFITLLLPVWLCAAEPASVPGAFRDLYSELEEELTRADNLCAVKAASYPVLFGAQLLSADSGRADKLLGQGEYDRVLTQLERLRSLGIKLVTIRIGFPALYQPFYKNSKDYAELIGFYKRLSDDIRSRGMRLLVKLQPLAARLGVAQDYPEAPAFLKGMKFKSYVKARGSALVKIARELRPDYLSIINEPDTEEMLSGQPLNDLAKSILLVNSVAADLRRARVKGVRLGAGVGLWHPRYHSFLVGFARCRRLDFIDLHIVPINLGLLERLEESAEIALSYGKRIGISEAWLYKCRTRELGKGNNAEELFGRDAFSFWEPLDEKFLRVTARLSRINQLDFFSLYWTKYLYAYLNYDKVKDLKPIQIADISSAQAANSLSYNKFTALASAYAKIIQEGE